MSQRRTLLLALGVVLLASLGSFSVAQAQYAPGYAPPYYPPPPPPPPPRGVYRAGLVYGFSLGFGGIAIDGCGDLCGVAGMGEFHIGGMVAPRLALMGDFWEGVHHFSDATYGDGETWNGVYTFAAQYWLTDIIWVKGGIGFGRLQLNGDADSYNGYPTTTFDDESGLAFLLAGGIEIMQTYNFALDIQFRYGNVAYGSDNGGAGDTSMYALMIGFNWY